MEKSKIQIADNWQTVLNTSSLMAIFNLDKIKLYYRATPVHCMIFKNVFTSAQASQNEGKSKFKRFKGAKIYLLNMLTPPHSSITMSIIICVIWICNWARKRNNKKH
jgi:hypothetical protein